MNSGKLDLCCAFCSKDFSSDRKKKYCSKECQDKARYDRRKKSFVCGYCGETFWRECSKNYIYKHCSYTCSMKNRVESEETKAKRIKTLNSPEFREKYEKSMMDKYGVINPFCLPHVKEKANSPESKAKRDKTVKECYGGYGFQMEKIQKIVHSEEANKKRNETKKRNGTYKTSKEEETCYKLLKENFKVVKRQYKSEEYPFHCDFYIPSEDLYIEFQGSPFHNKKPFNKETDQKELERLKTAMKNKQGASNGKFYKNIINTWTVRDVKKREYGESLNWLEFFTLEEFKTWLDSYEIKGDIDGKS